jgi:mRNA interferase YafQ
MLKPDTVAQFERDLKKAKKQHKPLEKLKKIMQLLVEGKPLDPKYLDHSLQGNWKGARECHIENDWLLIYRIMKARNEIWFERLGSHSELFK